MTEGLDKITYWNPLNVSHSHNAKALEQEMQKDAPPPRSRPGASVWPVEPPGLAGGRSAGPPPSFADVARRGAITEGSTSAVQREPLDLSGGRSLNGLRLGLGSFLYSGLRPGIRDAAGLVRQQPQRSENELKDVSNLLRRHAVESQRMLHQSHQAVLRCHQELLAKVTATAASVKRNSRALTALTGRAGQQHGQPGPHPQRLARTRSSTGSGGPTAGRLRSIPRRPSRHLHDREENSTGENGRPTGRSQSIPWRRRTEASSFSDSFFLYIPTVGRRIQALGRMLSPLLPYLALLLFLYGFPPPVQATTTSTTSTTSTGMIRLRFPHYASPSRWRTRWCDPTRLTRQLLASSTLVSFQSALKDRHSLSSARSTRNSRLTIVQSRLI